MVTAVTKESTIGFVGLGNLGQAMSLNLIDHGWSLVVVDKSDARLEPVVEAGAVRASVEDLAECSVVCFAVPDERAVDELLSGEEGLLERLGPDHTVVVHSTVLPSRARDLADRIHARGARFIDAPVSGGPDRARTGELTLMVGGDEDDLEAVGALFEDIASTVLHVGPVGAGSATKLGNQLIMFSALAGVHEALLLAAHYEVSPETLLGAVSSSTGDTWVGRNWGFFDRVAADYDASGTPVSERPWSKDLQEVVEAGHAAEIPLPVAEVLSQVLTEVVEQHAHRNADES